MPPIVWPVLWILAMFALIMATAIASLREKKSRAKSAPQPMQPMPAVQDAAVPLDGGDGFGASDGFGDDPFK